MNQEKKKKECDILNASISPEQPVNENEKETLPGWKAEDNPLLFILSLYRVGYTAMFRIFAAKYETEYENIEIR